MKGREVVTNIALGIKVPITEVKLSPPLIWKWFLGFFSYLDSL